MDTFHLKNPLRGSADQNQAVGAENGLQASIVSSLKMQSSVERSKENLTSPMEYQPDKSQTNEDRREIDIHTQKMPQKRMGTGSMAGSIQIYKRNSQEVVHQRERVHSAMSESTPQAPISRPGLVGQHCDRPPDCSACVVFFLCSALPHVGTDLLSVLR